MKEDLLKLKYSHSEIEKKTKEIYSHVLAKSKNFDKGNYEIIGVDDLKRLFELYDKNFFDGFFCKNYKEKISFRLSKRMTKSAGKVNSSKQTEHYTIALSTTLIFQTFDDIKREITVNGIVCHDRLEATMHVVEHEIIHLLELVSFGSTSCSKPRFKKLSNNIFGHTDVTHKLITQTERADKKFNLHVGDSVSFEYRGKVYQGTISRITKRATVMVKDKKGSYRDNQGDRCSKYYILLKHLRPANQE